MTRYISKLAAMLLAALLLPQTLLASGINAKAAEDFAQSKAMRGAKAGVCVIDMTTGEVVASLNEDIALTPASITKLITSAAAIKALSPNYRFSTEVVIDGLVDHAGVVNGNLIINAGLDPTLESRHFPEHESFIVGTIEGLKRLGIKRINGKVIVNESICPEPGVPADWEDADVTEDYGAGAHALNYADNQCSIIFDVSGKKAMIIDTLPHQSNLKIRNNVKVTTGRKSNWTPSASRKKNSNNLIVWGFVKRQDDLVELKTTTPDPANALTCDLTEAIVCEGIPVMKQLPPHRICTPVAPITRNRIIPVVPQRQYVCRSRAAGDILARRDIRVARNGIEKRAGSTRRLGYRPQRTDNLRRLRTGTHQPLFAALPRYRAHSSGHRPSNRAAISYTLASMRARRDSKKTAERHALGRQNSVEIGQYDARAMLCRLLPHRQPEICRGSNGK